jgi:hypothetical protein
MYTTSQVSYYILLQCEFALHKTRLNKIFSDILHSFYLKTTIKNNAFRKIVMFEFWN